MPFTALRPTLAGALTPVLALLFGLAERYGVHRHTVRQAFRHLAERGLVTVSRGRGTQVTAPRFPYKLGRRVSMRTNFGAAGIAVSGAVLASEIVAGEEEHCALLGLPVLAGGSDLHLGDLACRYSDQLLGSRSDNQVVIP